MLSTDTNFPLYPELSGLPLQNGAIYFGSAGLNPVTNPVTVYWDSAGTQPAVQPVKTLGGMTVRNGVPARVWVSGDYSRLVQDSKGRQVLFEANVFPLSGSTGSSAIGFTQSGVGAVVRDAQSKMRDIVNAVDFAGFDATGVASSVAAIAAAFTMLGAAGGLVFIPNGAKARIAASMSVPVNCALIGPHEYVGAPGTNASAPYGSMGGALLIDSTATVTLQSNSSASGLLVYRYGMTFPTTSAAAFAGTAFTVGGDDTRLRSCLVMGFNKAFYSSGFQRQTLTDILLDNVNGIEITNALDIPKLTRCSAWPFATIEAVTGGTSATALNRSGVAYNFHDTVDWGKMTDCFSYGYAIGFQCANVNSSTLLSCGADNTTSGGLPAYANSIGFNISGGENRLIGCQASAQDQAGVVVSTNAGIRTIISGLSVWNCTTHGVLLQAGDLTMTGSFIRAVNNGVTFASAASKFDGSANAFDTVTNEWNFSVTCDTSKIRLGSFSTTKSAGGTVVNGTLSAPSVVAADPLNIPISADIVIVTGATNFGTLQKGWADRPAVTLRFAGAPTVFNGTANANSMRLNGAANFVAAAGSTLTLKHDGTQWFEIGRSA